MYCMLYQRPVILCDYFIRLSENKGYLHAVNLSLALVLLIILLSILHFS